ncbi:thiamine monophosphate synthase [Brevundimonas sp. Root1423]|nr:thiamine monophosphate synthase [Brevundimonas sp. Root1423]
MWEVACVLARDAAKVSGASALPPLLFFTDPQRTPRPWDTAARLPAGAAVVFRHFGQPDARGTALRLREITAGRGVRLLIGLDADLADAVGADGVHLPERALDQARELSKAQPQWLITGAAHAGSALDAPGVHARVLSPVFPAGGPSGATPPLGLDRFSALAESAACPVYALGGVDAKNARSLIGSGACGIAGVSAIQAAFSA